MTSPYMPFFVGAYLADTMHLSPAEHGAYLLLIVNYWQRGKPLPDDDRKLARICRMTEAEWSEARDTLAEFFRIDDGLWRHKRIEAELAIVAKKTAQARAAARASADARSAPAQRPLSARSAPAATDAELLGIDKSREEGSPSRSIVEDAARDAPPDPTLRSEVGKLFEAANRMPPDTSRVEVWRSRGHDRQAILAAVRIALERKRNFQSLAYVDPILDELLATGPPDGARPASGQANRRKSHGKSDLMRAFDDLGDRLAERGRDADPHPGQRPPALAPRPA